MIPASIRNNNPGAIYPGPSARKFGGKEGEVLKSKDGKHPIVKFPTAVHGAAALFDNLNNARSISGYYYRNQTLAKAIETWCGAIRAHSYLALIKQQSGIEPTEVLTPEFLRDPERCVALAKAMARHEAGTTYPLDPQDWIEAHAMAFGGGDVAPEPSPNNDVPTMRPEARAAQTQETVTKWSFGLTAAGGGAALIPSVPQAYTDAVNNLGAWKGLLMQVGSLGSEAAVAGGSGLAAAGGAWMLAKKYLVRT
jgi:hypothetical protein